MRQRGVRLYSLPLSRGLMAGQQPLSRCAGGVDDPTNAKRDFFPCDHSQKGCGGPAPDRTDYSRPSWSASIACEASPTTISGHGLHRRFICEPVDQPHFSPLPRSRPPGPAGGASRSTAAGSWALGARLNLPVQASPNRSTRAQLILAFQLVPHVENSRNTPMFRKLSLCQIYSRLAFRNAYGHCSVGA